MAPFLPIARHLVECDNKQMPPEIFPDVLRKPRLLNQLGLPARSSPFEARWERSPDFFDDHFLLRARVQAQSIVFEWQHRPAGSVPLPPIWTLHIGLSPSGRARVTHCEGFSPPIQTLMRAADAIRDAIAHAQVNPTIVDLSPKNNTEPTKLNRAPF